MLLDTLCSITCGTQPHTVFPHFFQLMDDVFTTHCVVSSSSSLEPLVDRLEDGIKALAKEVWISVKWFPS